MLSVFLNTGERVNTMRQLYKYLPLPSDRMGVIWALSTIKDAYIIEYGPAGTTHYALEGLTQYNGELQAKLYTTHLEEEDLIMGDSGRLAETIKEVDEHYSPPVIFVLASSISSIVGVDIESICQELRDKVRAKLICFTGGGFRGDYTQGLREVLTVLAGQIVQGPREKLKGTYNIIGGTIDAYNFAADLQEIQNIMSGGFGYRAHTVFTANTSIKEIEQASQAEFNLVLRSEGLQCAEILQEKYGMPFVYGSPYGIKGTYQWVKKIEAACSSKGNELFFKDQAGKGQKHLHKFVHTAFTYGNMTAILSGAYDFALGILPFLRDELKLEIKKILIRHKEKGFAAALPAPLREIILFDSDEQQMSQLIAESNPSLLLGDGVLLELGAHVPVRLQLANPNLTHMIKFYAHTPFMGFNGAVYLTEVLLNHLQAQRKNLQARL